MSKERSVGGHRPPLQKTVESFRGYSDSRHPARHMGNAMITNPNRPKPAVTAETLNLESLKGKFDTDAYLSPYSDIVALMVFDHQMHMMNLITRVGWDYRLASSLEADMGKSNDI